MFFFTSSNFFSDFKNFFVQKSFFFQYLLFVQSQSCLLESTAAISRQSVGYVLYNSMNLNCIEALSFLKICSHILF